MKWRQIMNARHKHKLHRDEHRQYNGAILVIEQIHKGNAGWATFEVKSLVSKDAIGDNWARVDERFGHMRYEMQKNLQEANSAPI